MQLSLGSWHEDLAQAGGVVSEESPSPQHGFCTNLTGVVGNW